MKVHHSIVVRRDLAEPILRDLGIPVQAIPGEPLVSFDVTEDDPKWPNVQLGLQNYRSAFNAIYGRTLPDPNAGDRVWTEFSEEELKAASYLEVVCTWHTGYPQPERNMEYSTTTYDLSHVCTLCQSGARQRAPFRILKAPNWGRRAALQLNWVLSEIFVRRDVFESVFMPFGLQSLPVLLHKDGSIVESTVQLKVDQSCAVSVAGLEYSACRQCGTVTYNRSSRGPSPAPIGASGHLLKSREYFGGFDQRIYVSQAVYRKVIDRKLRGFEFRPVQSDK